MSTPKRQSSILNFFNSPATIENKEPNCSNTTPSKINDAVETPVKIVSVPTTLKEETCDERYEWMVNPKDFSGRAPGEDGYNQSQLFIPDYQWKKFTPFEKQFWDIKSKMYDSVVFFKKGKFYELYENDADIASSLFDLKIADRVNMKMAGVPESSFHIWASKFVSAGFRVVKVDQKDNSMSKQIKKKKGEDDDSKIIQREISGILTIGTLIDPSMIQGANYSFCLAIYIASCPNDDKTVYVSTCYCDFTLREYFTENYTDNLELTRLSYSLHKYAPKEIVVLREQGLHINKLSGKCANIKVSYIQQLCKPVEDVKCSSCLVMSEYMNELRFSSSFSSFRTISEVTENASLHSCSIDGRTLCSLEIISTNPKVKTVWKVFDKSKTAAGSRKLYRWLTNPLCSLSHIKARQEAVEFLCGNVGLRDRIRNSLSAVVDIERNVMGLRFAKDLKQSFLSLSSALCSLYELVEFLSSYSVLRPFVESSQASWDELQHLLNSLNQSFNCTSDEELKKLENSLNSILNELGEYKNNFCRTLKTTAEYRDIGKEHFLLEVDASIVVPKEYFAMSRTKNTVRYWCPYLKDAANKHDETIEMIKLRKDCLHDELIEKCMNNVHLFKTFSDGLSSIDCLQSMSIFASSFGDCICTPVFVEGSRPQMTIDNMRHPIFGLEPYFITNDFHMQDQDKRIMLLTGPNMGGKSTFMKQVCIFAILAQVGSLVPSSSYTASIFSFFHTRMGKKFSLSYFAGADDDIMRGASTFMCELEEAVSILQSVKLADTLNLVVMDEFGRGTSTHDGSALASAILDELMQAKNTLTIFSTHYRQVAENIGSGIDKQYMGFTVTDSGPIFTYKLTAGVSPSSFAFNVARNVGICDSILDDAGKASNLFHSFKYVSHSNSTRNDVVCAHIYSAIASLDTVLNK